ncbi:kelch-like protein 26 [Acanthaster planci]|uniref:Kelch-like protein 26 n=1 Tax=Acanthaster planci TaxID=133434 RepID=A0A8B7ZZB5_ACAPL|nr:kelch-like protein 26 [Acanthaster planci]
MDLDQSGNSSVLSVQHELTNCVDFPQLQSLATELDSLRHEGALCDVTVTVDERQFRAHKVVLAAVSDVFRAMFTGGLKEASQSEVVLQDEVDLSAEGFEILLDFAYSAKLNLTVDNVFEVLASACHLHVALASEGCIDFIGRCFDEGQLAFDDYLKISSMAGNYGLDRLKQTADHHIAGNFGEVSRTEDFLEHMTAHSLGQFLIREDLAVASEVEVLSAVVSWLHHDLATRIHHSASLLKKVRLGLVSSHHLVDLIDTSLLAVSQVKSLFDQLMQHIALHSPVSGQLANRHPELFTPRVSTKSLLAIGGQTSLGFARYFCSHRQEWIPLKKFAQLPFDGVSHHSVIAVAGKIFLVGGVSTEYRKSQTQNFFYAYDVVANKWSRLPSMRVERSHVALAHMDGYIYAVGGKDEKGQWLETVERYDLSKGKWQTVAAMVTDVSGMHPSAVAHENRIFVSAADLTEGVQYLSCFDPATNTWRACSRVKTSSPGCLVRLEGGCLLVTYQAVTSKLGKKEKWNHCPVVHEVTTYDHGQGQSHTIDRVNTHDQSLVPESDLRPFRVGCRIYLLVNGACLDSRTNVEEGQVYDVGLDAWTKLSQNIEGTGVTEYTFNAESFL